MAETAKPLLIKRYASRRLYNTETSDYVTLEDISGFIRAGREVQIVDLKSGDDLTRQYLLQIVAERESKGDTVLPTNLDEFYSVRVAGLRELARAGNITPGIDGRSIPEQLELIDSEARDLMRKQQEAFMKTMMGGVPGWSGSGPAAEPEATPAGDPAAELAEIKKQFAELQKKLSQL